MRPGLVLTFCLLSATTVEAQQVSRFISFAERRDPENAAYFQWRVSIPETIFRAAEKNQITLYEFADFNVAPKVQSFEKFEKKMIYPYDPWENSKTYSEASIISYKGSFFSSRLEVSGQSPDDTTAWEKVPPSYMMLSDLNLLGLDYIQTEGQAPQLQYVHFYIDDPDKYISSVRADDAVRLLNSTRVLWFSNDYRIMNQWGRDLFLLSLDENEKVIRDAVGNIDASRTTHLAKLSHAELFSVGILVSYKSGKVQNFLFFQDFSGAPVLDSISPSDIRAKPPTPNFMLLGEALLVPTNLKFSGQYKDAIQKPLKEKPGPVTSPKQVNRIAVYVTERLRFKGGVFNKLSDEETFQSLTGIASLIYDGVFTSRLRVYDWEKSDSIYSPSGAKERWMLPLTDSEYVSWQSSADYYTDDIILFKDTLYQAVADNINKSPGRNKDIWKVLKPAREFFEPAYVDFFDIRYHLIFDKSGNIISKNPVHIEAGISGTHTITGLDKTLGMIRYADLISFIVSKNPAGAKSLKQIFEIQNGPFQMIEYSSMTLAD